jgi:hypothetical protein
MMRLLAEFSRQETRGEDLTSVKNMLMKRQGLAGSLGVEPAFREFGMVLHPARNNSGQK